MPTLLPDPIIGTRLSFRLIFPDSRNTAPTAGPGRYMTRELGSIVIGDGGPGILPDDDEAAIVAGGQMAGPLAGEPEKTLQDGRFVIGDYVSCAILPALPNGGVAPPPSGLTRGGGAFGAGRGDFGGRGGAFNGARENGFGFRGRSGPRGGGFGQGMGIGVGVPTGNGEEVNEFQKDHRVDEGVATEVEGRFWEDEAGIKKHDEKK